jgi:signal transduction histidine kinase
MTNAIKFSPTHKNITLRLEGQARQVSISIQDEGQGFTAEDKAKVFQKFQKLTARPTAGESSTGLGLSIVKILTEKLGGHISLESEWQKGSTFTLTFPTFAVSL